MTDDRPFHFPWIETVTKSFWNAQFDFCFESKAKMTVESPFHFHWIAAFKRITKKKSLLKAKPKWRLKVPFISIELPLSTQITKRSSLTFTLKIKPKWRLEVLFIFIELWLSKKLIRMGNLLSLWKQRQNDSWECFSFSLHCDFLL